MLSTNNNYEFCVRIASKKATEYIHNEETYIEGRKGSEYELYFKNNTHHKVKVVFSVDGLDVIDGKTASDESKGYIVFSYGDITIPGWMIDSKKAAKFQFSPRGAKENTSYVELLQEEGFDVDIANQGVIGCLVFKEVYHAPQIYPYYVGSPIGQVSDTPHLNINNVGVWYNEVNAGYASSNLRGVSFPNEVNCGHIAATMHNMVGAPAATVSPSMSSSTAYIKTTPIPPEQIQPSLGTAFGDDVKFATRHEIFERHPTPDWIGIINYDTIQGLRKRGIIIERGSASKAFPGYKQVGCFVPRNR